MDLRYCSNLSISEAYKPVLQACNLGLIMPTEIKISRKSTSVCDT